MKEEDIIHLNDDEATESPKPEPKDTGQNEGSNEVEGTQPQTCAIDEILNSMGASNSIATSTRAILHQLRNGDKPSKSIVKLIVQALNRDEDIKNAEAAGYLRGRNEKIEMATKPAEKDTQPVNFPVYRRRSFWDM